MTPYVKSTEPLYIKLIIPVKPRTKKNSQQIMKAGNKRWIGPSKAAIDFELQCGWWIKTALRKKINEPVNVRVRFFVDSKRKVDLTNLLESIDDVLVRYGVLADDNAGIIAGHDGSRVYVDRIHPRLEIEIRPIEMYDIYNHCTKMDEPEFTRY